MKRVHGFLIILLGYYGMGMGVTVRAQEQPVLDPRLIKFGQSTTALRRIIFDDFQHHPRILRSIRELTAKDLPTTLIVVLGSPHSPEGPVLQQIEQRLQQTSGRDFTLRQFVKSGGALLIATDHELSGELGNNFHVKVDGRRVRATTLRESGKRPSHPRNRGGDTSTPNYWRNHHDCPIVQPRVPDSASILSKYNNLNNIVQEKLGRGGVATNMPSFLVVGDLEPTLSVLAHFPPNCYYEKWNGHIEKGDFPFAVGGEIEAAGRVLILADHSIFINSMMLQPDTRNVEFAYQAIHWLRGDPSSPRTQVLFIEDGAVCTQFDLPVKPLPPLPPPEALVELADEALANLQKENAFNKMLLHYLPRPILLRDLFLLLSMGLVVYGLCRLTLARHHFPTTVLEKNAAFARASTDVLKQRHQEILKRRNFWEAAHELARHFFESILGVEVRENLSPPLVEVRGNFWQRWLWNRRLQYWWRLAADQTSIRVSPRLWKRLIQQFNHMQADLANGLVHIHHPTVRAPLQSVRSSSPDIQDRLTSLGNRSPRS